MHRARALTGLWLSLIALGLVAACAPTPLGVAPTALPTATRVAVAPTTAPATGPTAAPGPTIDPTAIVLPGTAAPNFPIQITEVRQNTVNVADVAATLNNVSPDPVDMGNWIMLYGTYQITVPATQYVTIAPGESKTFHLASSTFQPTGTDVYVGTSSLDKSRMIIPNQLLVLLNPQRQLISAMLVPPESGQ